MQKSTGKTNVKKDVPKHCCYGICTSDSREKNTEQPIHFVSFPQPCIGYQQSFITTKELHVPQCWKCSKCDLWVRRCGREDGRFQSIKDVTKDTYICSLHFVGGNGPSYDYPDPIDNRKGTFNQVQLENEILTKQFTRKKIDIYPKTASENDCKEDVQNHCIEIKQEKSSTPPLQAHSNDLSTPIMVKKIKTENSNTDISDQDQNLTASIVIFYPEDSPLSTNTITYDNNQLRESIIVKNPQCAHDDVLEKAGFLRDQSIQTECKKITKVNKRIQVKRHRLSLLKIFENSIKVDEKKCTYYTGLTYDQITILQNLVHPVEDFTAMDQNESNKEMQKLTSIQQLILTLIHFRIKISVEDISYRFDIPLSFVREIVRVWLEILYNKFKVASPLQFLYPSFVLYQEEPEREAKYKSLKNIKVIIDCTEFQCEVPVKEEGRNSCCFCKPKSVYRALIGCTSRGGVCFVSDLYEGNMSYSEIFVQSKLADHLEPGDIVIANKKFAIRDIVESKHAYLNVPPYLKGKKKLSSHEESELKQILEQRQYIKGVIAKIKNFQYLQAGLSPNLRPLMSKVLYVCACLVNLQPPDVIK